MIVTETNIYGREKSKENEWIDIVAADIYAFLSIIIFMGVHKLPSINDYWSDDPVMLCPFVRKIMPRKMFWKIWTNLHLNDNKLDTKEDKFYKVRKLTDVMKSKFQKNWNISSRITIDEMMIKFKGLSNVKQYLPLKPTKWAENQREIGSEYFINLFRFHFTIHFYVILKKMVLKLASKIIFQL